MPHTASRRRVIRFKMTSVTEDVDSFREDESRRRRDKVEDRQWFMASSESAAKVS